MNVATDTRTPRYLTLRDEYGEHEVRLVGSDDYCSRQRIVGIVRAWGELHEARSVWFQIAGCSAATLDCTRKDSWPEEVEEKI